MKNVLAYAIIFILSVLTQSQTIIPEWFEELPAAPPGVRFAVGYSGKYVDRARAREAAISQALTNMVKQRATRLVFELEEFSDGRYRLMNPSFEMSYDESTLKDIRENFTPVDSSITNEGYFILITCPKTGGHFSISSTDKEWGKRPKWTEKLPRSKRYNYGVGIVSNYSSWVRAWKDADEYARFDLAKNIKIETRSIHTTERDNRYIIESKILHQSFDENIVGSEIISRWYDEKKDAYYSLCRQPCTDSP